jgi:hypothetical protein
MTQLRRLVSYLIGGVSITLALLLGRGEIALSQSTPSYAAHPRFEATYLDQGWGYDTAEWWYTSVRARCSCPTNGSWRWSRPRVMRCFFFGGTDGSNPVPPAASRTNVQPDL